MKKYIAFLLVLVLVISMVGCGTAAPQESQISESTPQETRELEYNTQEPETTEQPMETEAPSQEPQASQEEPEPVTETEFFNPLTGEPTEQDISQNRPYTAMLNTIQQALPQSSNSQADMLIEATEEGGITRVMGVYQDLTGVGTIGTIRSTREYFVYLTMGLDALLIHAGTSTTAEEELAEHEYKTVDYLDGASAAFWRDQWRVENIASEHSLYTNSENVLSYVSGRGWRTTHEEDFENPYVFTEDGTPADGQSAQQISVSFSGYKTTRFDYDESSKTYQVYAYDEPYMDEAADTQVAVTNVVVIPTEQTSIDGTLQRFDLSQGEGYFACGGKYIPIRWEKGGEEDPLRFYNQDGSILELGVGKTYICLLGDTRPITFE